MGCGACRIILEDNTDKPLDWVLSKLPVNNTILAKKETEMLNEYYTRAEMIIEMVEDLRETIIDSLDELILKTGAYVFVNPDIVNCIDCVLWKVSVDNGGDLKLNQIKFFEDEPYFQIKGGTITPESVHIISNLVTYISNFFSLKNQIKHIDLKIPELIYLITENNEANLFSESNQVKFTEEINKDEENKDKIPLKSELNKSPNNKSRKQIYKIIQDNNQKIKKTINLFPDLISTYNLNLEKIKYHFACIKRDPNSIVNINKVGEYAYNKKMTDIADIAFNSKNIEFVKEKEDGEEDEENEQESLYMKTISEGRKKYEDILQSKLYMKNKRLARKEV